MKISYIYLFQSSVLLFGLSSNHIAESDAEVCDVRYFCTIMSWLPWSSCEQNCSKPASQFRRRFLCFNDLAVSNPTREKVLRYCNMSNLIPFEERRTCERVNCLTEIENASIARENCSSLNDRLELPVWIQGIEFMVLAVVSSIFLMTLVCVCRMCGLFWGCIAGNKDDDIEINRGRKKIPKGKISAISNKESVMAMSLVNV